MRSPAIELRNVLLEAPTSSAAPRPKMKTSPKKIWDVPKCPIQLHDVGQPIYRSFYLNKRGKQRRAKPCHEFEIFPAIDGAKALLPAHPIVWKPGPFACV